MTQMLRLIVACRFLATVAVVGALAACGGGGGSSATTSSSASVAPLSSSDSSPPAGSPPSSSTSSIGAATLSWAAPDENTDGSALTNLAGYRIYFGTSADALDQVIDIPSVGITTYVVDDLNAGTYYFSIRAYNTVGAESALSNIVSDTIT
jgi:hypothetical protein